MKSFLSAPIVCLITRGDTTADNFEHNKTEIIKLVDLAVDLGVSMIQIREKRLSAGLLLSLVRDAARLTAGTGTKLLVNDRADIAVAGNADGVHLTTVSPPVGKIRDRFGEDLIIGVSAHSSEAVGKARLGGADFAVYGPVFMMPGKAEPVGLDRVVAVCTAHDPFPVLALGGIDSENYRAALDAGAAGFAAIRSLNNADSLRKIMNEIRSL